MTPLHPHRVPAKARCRAWVAYRTAGLALTWLLLALSASGQDPDSPKARIEAGYAMHQSVDLGGRVVDSSGSAEMYDTLVNLQSGPRILNQSLDMHAVAGTSHRFFDDLMWSNSGYGGDPIDVTTLRMSKGKLYNFQGLFRRDRQYFDYNLLDNPLVPPGVTSNGYTFPQVSSSPHSFNTVRRMTDVGLTLFPISKISLRTGYSHNTDEGPSYSSQHNGAEAIYLQNWRNSTDTWLGAVDWKPIAKTMFTFEEHVTHYKGDTNWQLTALNLQLSNGMPVTLGFDNQAPPNCGDGNPPIVTSSTTPPTANPTCSGYLQYFRTQPTRTLIPTEEFRFLISNIKNIEMNGSLRYTGASMSLPSYNEFFNGLDNQGKRVFTTTGFANGQRVDVGADLGIVWQISQKLSLSDQYDFVNFREPVNGFTSEVDLLGNSMLSPPGAPQPPATTFAHTFLQMKTETNTLTVGWEPTSKASISLGYRYQERLITWIVPPLPNSDTLTNGTAYTVPIYENAGILGFVFQPTRQWRINARFEASYDDRAYTQISPRQLYHYRFQSRYKPREWATITGTFNDIERRDNITLVNHRDHNRSISLGALVMPSPRYGLDLSYGYSDIFSQTTLCYAATPAPPGAIPVPANSGCLNANKYLGTGYYDAPTQYASFGVSLSPVKKVRASAGYRISAVNGNNEFLNPRQVAGSLQSKYQSPYINVAWTLHAGVAAKASWDYYGYGEDGPIGPTLPRNFHADILTLALHYDF